MVTTNVAVAVPPNHVAIVNSPAELLQRGVLALPASIGYFDTEEIVVPVRNLTESSITLKVGTLLAELRLVGGRQEPVQAEFTTRLPAR